MPCCRVTPVMLDFPPATLCARRYPGHPKGCPNLGKRLTCPPQAALWTPKFLASRAWYAVWNVFPFGEHVEKMRVKHPEWTERQLANCLYWQGTARKQLVFEISAFARYFMICGLNPKTDVITSNIPEAHGVNVTATMKSIGIELEWPPRNVAYQVALAGIERCTE